MKRYVLFAAACVWLAASPCVQAAESGEAERRLMENIAADEDGWSGDAQGEDGMDAPAAAPEYLEEQNPHENMRRPAVPADSKAPAGDDKPPAGSDKPKGE